MTLSAEDQKANINDAFRAMMSGLADRSIALTFFDPNGEDLRVICQTTWKELIDQKWVEERELEDKLFTGSQERDGSGVCGESAHIGMGFSKTEWGVWPPP